MEKGILCDHPYHFYDVVAWLLKRGHTGHICFTLLLLWFNLRNGPPCMNVKLAWISEESDGVGGALQNS